MTTTKLRNGAAIAAAAFIATTLASISAAHAQLAAQGCSPALVPVPSSVRQPIALPDGVTAQTTVTATNRFDSNHLCLPELLVDYSVSRAPSSTSMGMVNVSLAVAFNRASATTAEPAITVQLAPGQSATGSQQFVGVADTFTPRDSILIALH